MVVVVVVSAATIMDQLYPVSASIIGFDYRSLSASGDELGGPDPERRGSEWHLGHRRVPLRGGCVVIRAKFSMGNSQAGLPAKARPVCLGRLQLKLKFRGLRWGSGMRAWAIGGLQKISEASKPEGSRGKENCKRCCVEAMVPTKIQLAIQKPLGVSELL